jgi:hypothetical protein
MFNFRLKTDVPGFRVGETEGTPGFALDPNSLAPTYDPSAPNGNGFPPVQVPQQAPALQPAAAGDLQCEGFSGGCQSGGDYGTTAEYYLGNPPRNMCMKCALKYLGLESEPSSGQRGYLQPWSINPR